MMDDERELDVLARVTGHDIRVVAVHLHAGQVIEQRRVQRLDVGFDDRLAVDQHRQARLGWHVLQRTIEPAVAREIPGEDAPPAVVGSRADVVPLQGRIAVIVDTLFFKEQQVPADLFAGGHIEGRVGEHFVDRHHALPQIIGHARGAVVDQPRVEILGCSAFQDDAFAGRVNRGCVHAEPDLVERRCRRQRRLPAAMTWLRAIFER